MAEEQENNVPSPVEPPEEAAPQKETPPAPPSPDTTGISEAERQKIIEEERERVKNEQKLQEEAVKTYKKEHNKGFGLVKGLLVLLVLAAVVVAGGILPLRPMETRTPPGGTHIRM
ncbi:hypothetical protein [Methanogenium cariaci]|uniref:hypothetical protein n=1 Tax=Methanogenium cariaci TaxID=2197 RepID=UPI0007822768|nr:hypothetical protein [Methanogenium cariaci]